MSDVFAPGGILAARLPGFEYRPQQAHMARAVEEALRTGGVTLIEAGTGTGKSLAYLIPAARFALETARRVVVSTNTINLQEQLLHKDIPWVQREIAPELRAVLVKGWQNYLCLYRYEQVLHSPGDLLDPGEDAQLAAVRAWVADGPAEGSRHELPFTPSPGLWNSICAESDFCLRQACPWYDHCFLFKARRAVADAHLLIVNHHLLFADVAVRSLLGWQSDAVLPAYAHVILDEAHHIEDVASEHLGQQFSEAGWRQFLGRLLRTGRGDEPKGVLGALQRRLAAAPNAVGTVDHIAGAVRPALEAAHRQGQAFFAAVAAWAEAQARPEGGEAVWSIVQDAAWRSSVAPAADALVQEMRSVAGQLERLASLLKELGDDWNGDAVECEALSGRALRLAEGLAWLAAAGDPQHVFWLEAKAGQGGRTNFALRSAPLHVGDRLAQWFGEGLECAVLCSATLTVGGSFNYILSRLGAQDAGGRPAVGGRSVRTLAIASPFDYRRQAAVFVPVDIADPDEAAFAAQFAASCAEVLVASGGRAFVLFTSYAHLRQTADAVREELARHGIPLWVHGEAPRSQLLRSFLGSPGSVLFGTDSFWEGVDVQGSALSVVIIARLPFEVPTHPLAKARADRLRQEGKNPFTDDAVPRAALKLKQGFGRLIRSKSDRGVVIIYDKRILTRRYGSVLRASLPPAPWYAVSLDELPQRVAARLAESWDAAAES